MYARASSIKSKDLLQATSEFLASQAAARKAEPVTLRDQEFAFVSYDDERDAEEAKTEMHMKRVGGLEISVQWSKKSGRFEENENRRKRSDGRDGRDGRDSRDRRRRGSSRSPGRSGSRDRRVRRSSRSRSLSHGRRVRRVSRSRSDSRVRRVRRTSRSNSNNRRGRRDERRPTTRRSESPRKRRDDKLTSNGRNEKRDVSPSPKNIPVDRDEEQL